MSSLEYGKYSIAFASGCGAMTALLHLFKTGDHFVVCDDVYGGTQRYMRLFSKEKFGFEIDFVDMTNIENVQKAIKPTTKMIWVETPTNPTLKLIDLEAIAKLAKEKNILTVGDNTFCNPYLQSPLLLGIDISLNSCTKYIGGHSDVVMGVLVFNCEKLYKELFLAAKSIGACPSPFDSYLCIRGLKTLEVRTMQICRNGYHLAHFLEKHPLVEKTIYPGLKSHPQHEIARKQMRGFGGMISFLIKGGLEQASKFLRAVKVFTLAESLGGVEGIFKA
jgi:cystathionine gamma-lyase